MIVRSGLISKSAVIVIAMVCVLAYLINGVNALELTNRTIQVSTAIPSANSTHSFSFGYQSPGMLGSMVFEYCDNTPIIDQACNPPAGIDVTGATIVSQTGNTGFNIDAVDTTPNKLVINRVPAVPSAVTPASYSFSNILNPSLGGQTIYVRISSYVSTDGNGPYTDNGSVAFSTVNTFNIGASVPPFLQICAAITVAPDCSSSSGDQINLGTLSTSAARFGQSQFAVGTNSISGYNTYILGTTLTSGNNTIPSLSLPTPSFPGNRQFGINLRNNTNPNVGDDPFGTGSGTVSSGYNTPNLFKFSSGDPVVSSSLPTDFNRLTVSYLVNINSAQPGGIYSSTFTYLVVGTF